MNMQRNNNKGIINRLASASVKHSKLRIIFTVLTIILSVSLISGMALFGLGIEKKKDRQVEGMQHVIYYDMSQGNMNKLKKNESVRYLSFSKLGVGVEYKDKIIQPSYFDQKPTIGDSSDMTSSKVSQGKYPEKMNEIAVFNDFGKTFGIETKVGEKVTIEFLNGQKETFVIAGIFNNKFASDILPIYMSKEYAEKGPQLKDVKYMAAVKFYGAEDMSQSEFEEYIVSVAEECGISRPSVNPNNAFVDALSGGSMEMTQMLTIIGVGLGILFVSILVIYSIFYISVVGRIKQFGQLRTVGMTRKQLKKMIIREGLILSAMGIPMGLIIGGIAGYIIMPDGWSWLNTLLVFVVVTIVVLITILLSIMRPAKIAAKMAPVEALKYSGYEIEGKKKRTRKLKRSITPFSLANMSVSRNRKKAVLTVVSLGIGGILFLTATTFITSTSLEGYSRQSTFKDGEFHISLSENAINTAKNGMTGVQENNPLSKEFIDEIKSIDGVKDVYEYKMFDVKWESKGEYADEKVTYFKEGDLTKDDVNAGSIDYDKLVANNEIIISGNETVKEVFGWEYKVGDTMKMTYTVGNETKTKKFKVGAIINGNYNYKNLALGWFLLPKDTFDEMAGSLNTNSEIIVATNTGKTAHVEKALDTMMQAEPELVMDTLSDRMEMDKQTFSGIFGVILGLSIFIIGFSLINLINTLITNILSRKREFAAIQSIGMTHKQLRQMIVDEGLLLALGNILITLVVGTGAAYLLVSLMQNIGVQYMEFTFPIIYMIIYACVIVGIPIIISGISVRMFRKQSLVDRLRVAE